MLMLTLLFPIPALHFKFIILCVSREQFCWWNVYHLPVRVKVVHDDLCSGCLDERVIAPDLQEFQIWVTFVPEIEKWVSIHELPGSPLHLIMHWITKKLLLLSEQGSNLMINFPGFTLCFWETKSRISVWFLAPATAPKVVSTEPIKSSFFPSSSSKT